MKVNRDGGKLLSTIFNSRYSDSMELYHKINEVDVRWEKPAVVVANVLQTLDHIAIAGGSA